MEGPRSLLAICASAEKQTLDHIWYRGRARQKKQHVVNFQTTENKLVALHSSQGEDALEWLCGRQRIKTHKERPLFVEKPRT